MVEGIGKPVLRVNLLDIPGPDGSVGGGGADGGVSAADVSETGLGALQVPQAHHPAWGATSHTRPRDTWIK